MTYLRPVVRALPPLAHEVPIRQLRPRFAGSTAASMFAVLAATARSAGGGPTDKHLQPRHPSCSFNANITDANGVQSEPDKPCFFAERAATVGLPRSR